jgi:hypothetical protein
LRPIVKITWVQFCTIDPHEGRNARYSSSTKVEYATDITLGRLVWLKSYRVQCKKRKKNCYRGCYYRVQINCFQCYIQLLFAWNFASQCVIFIIVKWPIWYFRVPHSQTFLAGVQRLWENGTFRPRSVDRDQERTPRVLDLEPQILETVEENPSRSINGS